ncbi:MAG: TonB-dependent receptor [Pseudomonadota bacterium]
MTFSKSGLLASAALVFTCGISNQVLAQVGEEADTPVEVITVMANRRPEVLSDVPSSVTAITDKQLSNLNAARFDDIISQIPNLSFSGRGPGQRQVILRGISTSTNEPSATVATYIDDIAVGSSTALATGGSNRPDVNIFDLERIEVLRGPQGTLYGANSLGGLLKYVTKRPDFDDYSFEGRAEFTTVDGGGSGYSLNAAANAPLSETVAARVSGFIREEGGFVDNVATGEENINDLQSIGGRLVIEAKATEDLTLRATVMYQDLEIGGNAVADIDNTGEFLFGPYQQSRVTEEPLDQSVQLYSLVADWDLGFATLVSTTSYNILDSDRTVDFSQFDATFVTNRLRALEVLGPDDPDLTVFPAERTSETKRFTQEIQLISEESDTLEWMAGFFYTDESSLFVDDEQGFVDNNAPRSDGIRAFFSRNESDFTQFAFFGNVTYHFTEDLDLTAGIRYSDNSTDLIRQNETFAAPFSQTELDASDDAVTFLISPRWRITDDVMVYARAASGFRPGGPNIIGPAAIEAGALQEFGSDNLWNYEIGIKASTPDDRFTVEATAFLVDWSDVQIRTSIDGFFFVGNAGKARSTGAEASFTAQPIDGLTLGFNLGYVDAQLTEDANEIGGLDGDRLPNAPEWTLGGYANYEFPIGDTVQGRVGGSFRTVTDRLSDFDRRFNPRLTLDGYTIVNLNAGLIYENFQLDIYAKNLTDKAGVESIIANFVPRTATLAQPRTFGISLTGRF